MIVRKETLDRLRALAASPDRVAMNRNVMMPTVGMRINDLNKQLEDTRAGLREALAIIDIIDAEDAHAT